MMNKRLLAAVIISALVTALIVLGAALSFIVNRFGGVWRP